MGKVTFITKTKVGVRSLGLVIPKGASFEYDREQEVLTFDGKQYSNGQSSILRMVYEGWAYREDRPDMTFENFTWGVE
jgi:hypothetical protein